MSSLQVAALIVFYLLWGVSVLVGWISYAFGGNPDALLMGSRHRLPFRSRSSEPSVAEPSRWSNGCGR